MAKHALRASSKKMTVPKTAMNSALTVSRPELLVDGSDEKFRRLVHGLLAFLARHQTLREGHASVIDLAGVEYTTLISISHLSAGGDVHVRAVADHLHLSGAFVTTVTNKLMTKGLIRKASHPGDRRRLSLTVTPRGAELLNRLAPAQMRVNDVQFDALSAKDFHQLLELVERLVESSDRAISLQRYLSEIRLKAVASASKSASKRAAPR